jgi:hypothetical protein
MGFWNNGTTLSIQCDYCQTAITSAHTDARVGLHGARQVFAHAGRCAEHFSQFFLNTKDRELTVSAFVAEVAVL